MGLIENVGKYWALLLPKHIFKQIGPNRTCIKMAHPHITSCIMYELLLLLGEHI